MSAFIVTKKHIDAIVNFAHRNDIYTIYFDDADHVNAKTDCQRIGQILWDANYASVNCRYNETDLCPTYNCWFASTLELTAVEMIKALQCLDYQSCEVDDWKKTKAYKIIQHFKGVAIQQLPGYDAAPWGII